MKIEINKHSSICINGNIFIDPLHLSKSAKAKYIFITHPHWDHFSIEDINKILDRKTILICPKSMENEASKISCDKVLVEPESTYHLPDLDFTTFRAYNIDKKFHPKGNDWVGYKLRIEDKDIAIIGDSDLTSELSGLSADILIVPIGGTYTMNVDEAIKLTNMINPQIVIPSHYGEIVGNKEMGKTFADKINKNIECELLI